MAQAPEGLEITWFGHATFLIKTPEGKRIMVDPWVMQNPACPEHLKDPGDIDAMLITHAHFDHIDDVLELARAKKPEIACIIETGAWLQSKGIENVTTFNIGGTIEFAGCAVHMTHAIHSCGIQDGDQIIYGGEAAGFVVEYDGFRIYHAGDTAVFSDMALIGKLLKPDLALLPIGDHFTMGPRSAAEATRLLGVPAVIPMHFGTFPLLTGTVEDYREATSDIANLEIIELKPGDTWS